MKGLAMRSLSLYCIFFSVIAVQSQERSNSSYASEITVTLNMHWDVQPLGNYKTIPASFITKAQNGTSLMEILNKAANENKRGPYNKYDSVYRGGIGYAITAMNGIKQDSKAKMYWQIFDGKSGKSIPCAMSSYVPGNGSSVIFRFTTYSADSDHNVNPVSGYCKQASSINQVPVWPITVTIALDWSVANVDEPNPAPYTTTVSNSTVLLDIINKAADENTQGPFNNYTSTYYGGLGHSLTAFKGVDKDPKASIYWMIYDNTTGKLAPLGASQYKPKHGSVTVLRLTKITSYGPPSTMPTGTVAFESSGRLSTGMGMNALFFFAVIGSLVFCN